MRAPSSLTVYVLSATTLLLLALWLRQLLLQARFRFRAKRRQAVASAGERWAKQRLQAEGFRIVAEQLRAPLQMRVDGETVHHEVRADLLVERHGQRFVAEVKTGTLAPSVAHGPTRRQLLEYSLVYPVAGILLVDVTHDRIHRIDFPFQPRRTGLLQTAGRYLIAATSGATAYYLWQMWR